MVIKFDTADDDFDDLTGGVIASSFTHKIPIKVEDANGNQEQENTYPFEIFSSSYHGGSNTNQGGADNSPPIIYGPGPDGATQSSITVSDQEMYVYTFGADEPVNSTIEEEPETVFFMYIFPS